MYRNTFAAVSVVLERRRLCVSHTVTILAFVRQSLGLLLNAIGSSLILESLSTSGIIPGLSGASSDAQDSVLRTVSFFLSF